MSVEYNKQTNKWVASTDAGQFPFTHEQDADNFIARQCTVLEKLLDQGHTIKEAYSTGHEFYWCPDSQTWCVDSLSDSIPVDTYEFSNFQDALIKYMELTC